ncbi:MAG: FecR family protein [Rhodospirillales bacterium]
MTGCAFAGRRVALAFAVLLVTLGFCLSPVLASPGLASNVTDAGRVVSIKGDAKRSDGAGMTELKKGSALFVGDTLETGPDARLKVRFRDGSTLSLSGAASLVIDDMIYDARDAEGDRNSQGFQFLSGVFRYVSGTIAKAKPEQVALTTPVATIGIRGTDVIFGVLTVGMPEGTAHYGFNIQEGAVEIDAPGGSVILKQPGEGTFLPLAREAAPTPVRQWTQEELQEALDLLAF